MGCTQSTGMDDEGKAREYRLLPLLELRLPGRAHEADGRQRRD